MPQKENLAWIDLEMTGLNPDVDRIIEIATIVTDSQLNIIAQGPVISVFQEESLLNQMDDWNTKHHTESGLINRVHASKTLEKEAQQQTINFLQEHVDKNQSPICGNSIGHDRRFLIKYMPDLESFFHYRNLDVSTVKELARRWRPDLYEGFTKKGTHQALEDIKESIEELKYYKEHFFK